MHARGLLQVCLTRSHMDVHAGIFVCPTSAQDCDSLVTEDLGQSFLLTSSQATRVEIIVEAMKLLLDYACIEKKDVKEHFRLALSCKTSKIKSYQTNKKEAKSKRQKSKVIMSVTIPSQMQQNLEKNRYAKTPTGNDWQAIDNIGDIHRLDSATLLSTQES